MFQAAHAWGVSPSEFWDMTPNEWFAIFQFEQDKAAKDAGRLTAAEERELRAWVTEG